MYRRQPRPFISQDEFVLMEIIRSKKEREQPFLPVNPFPPELLSAEPGTYPKRQENHDIVNIQAPSRNNQLSRRNGNKVVAGSHELPTDRTRQTNHHVAVKNAPINPPVSEPPVFNFLSDAVEVPEEPPVFNFLSEPIEPMSSEFKTNTEASKNLKAFLSPSSVNSSTALAPTVSEPAVSISASNTLKSMLLVKPEPGPTKVSQGKEITTASVASLKSLLTIGAPTKGPNTPAKTSYASVTKSAATTDVKVTTRADAQVPAQKALPRSKSVQSQPDLKAKLNSTAKASSKRTPTDSKRVDAVQAPVQALEKFASSKMLASPDPLNLPLPDFEESFFS